MNFYKAQDHAKRTTRRLVGLFIVAILALVALTELMLLFFFGAFKGSVNHASVIDNVSTVDPTLAITVALGVVGVIGAASLFRWIQLRGGGAAVAIGMGGNYIHPDSTDPVDRRVLNVVEEMAIASGIPVPPVYVLEEPSINAFAAGHSIDNAVIGVTRGCIDLLTRDELQGVMAHEFSHIVQGDMQLNIRLISVLNGILFITIIGNALMRGSLYSRSRRNGSGGAMVGLGLIVIGYIGVFFGNLIKASVSRQREYLADASAVQFTRNPKGIADALKKIGGLQEGADINHPRAQEASHMFFGSALHLSSMMATHPPLVDRITKLDPSFNGSFEAIDHSLKHSIIADEAMGFAATTAASAEQSHSPIDLTATNAADLAGEQAVERAHEIVGELDTALRDAAHDLKLAPALTVAIIDEHQVAEQFSWYDDDHKQAAALVQNSHDSHLIPILEICLGTMRGLSDSELQAFKQKLVATIKADNEVSIREWALYQVVREPLFPINRGNGNKKLSARTADAITLIAAVAQLGDQPQRGFEAALEALGAPKQALPKPSIKALDQALARIIEVKVLELPKLLKAITACMNQDGAIQMGEYELLRAICAALKTPLPPLKI